MGQDIHLNVPVEEKEAQRIKNEEESWTPIKLISLMLGTLGICLIILYVLAEL